MDFYKDNSPVSFNDFTSNVLAENKLLKIPTANNPVNNNPTNTQTERKIIAGGNSGKYDKYLQALQESENTGK